MYDLQKAFLKWICIGLGTLLVLTSIGLTVTAGMSVNNLLTFLLGTGLLILGLFYAQFPKYLKWGVNVIIAAGSIFLFTVAMLIRSANKDTVTYDEDIVIVLGSGIKGESLTPMLQSRLDRALRYQKENPNAIIIVTGGKGPGEDITEAEAMERYLLVNEINPDQVMREETSTNTYENLANTKKILNDFKKLTGIDSTLKIAVITSDFHMYRAKHAAQKLGMDITTAPAPLAWYMRPGTFLRETLSLLKFWFLNPIDKVK